MKTRLIIEIETPDTLGVYEDADKSEDDYTDEQLKEFRAKYCKNLHDTVVHMVRQVGIKDSNMQENIAEQISEDDETSIEDWFELDDYKVKITDVSDPNGKFIYNG